MHLAELMKDYLSPNPPPPGRAWKDPSLTRLPMPHSVAGLCGCGSVDSRLAVSPKKPKPASPLSIGGSVAGRERDLSAPDRGMKEQSASGGDA